MWCRRHHRWWWCRIIGGVCILIIFWPIGAELWLHWIDFPYETLTAISCQENTCWLVQCHFIYIPWHMGHNLFFASPWVLLNMHYLHLVWMSNGPSGPVILENISSQEILSQYPILHLDMWLCKWQLIVDGVPSISQSRANKVKATQVQSLDKG